ncbi:hypothetical protein Pst134EA_032912 [Puccinia striiformis f. sp. tritici]|uniref:uncharacterized protein n=1 Tax=Puccinia striiformis f. sp. tritici TaxID=168172 RepID=UPI0020088603|nr:uncharacterized protein Pst134EA_032912 [Puccinia striiformis f. sp. tritici]KAH9441520.1 hypothetical protein Pst134EA_032912 [Puccinia striiformis f. sp. tritici]
MASKAIRFEKENKIPRIGIFSSTAAPNPSNRNEFSRSTINNARSNSLIFFIVKYRSNNHSDKVSETRNDPTIVFKNGTKFSGSKITDIRIHHRSIKERTSWISFFER